MKNDTLFSFGIVYKLGLLRFFLFALLLCPILLFSLAFYILIFIILFLFFLLSLRFFRFYDSHFEISFLFGFIKATEIIPYKNIDRVTYKFGQYGGMPTIIIRQKKDWKSYLYEFFIYRFVVGNRNKVVSLFRFLDTKNVETTIFSNSNSKQNLIDQIKA